MHWDCTYIRRDICVIFLVPLFIVIEDEKNHIVLKNFRLTINTLFEFSTNFTCFIRQSFTLSIYYAAFLPVFFPKKEFTFYFLMHRIANTSNVPLFFLSIVCSYYHLWAWLCVSFLYGKITRSERKYINNKAIIYLLIFVYSLNRSWSWRKINNWYINIDKYL